MPESEKKEDAPDQTLEVNALKEEITRLKNDHQQEIQKLTDENNSLKTKLVNYLTFDPAAKQEPEKSGGLQGIDDWISGKD